MRNIFTCLKAVSYYILVEDYYNKHITLYFRGLRLIKSLNYATLLKHP